MGYSKKDKILARREFLTKLGVLGSLPILESLSLSGDALAQGANAKKCKRLIVVSQPHMAGRHRIPDLSRGDLSVSSSKYLSNQDGYKLRIITPALKHCLASSTNISIVPKNTILGIISGTLDGQGKRLNRISSFKKVGTKSLNTNVVLHTKHRPNKISKKISKNSLSQKIYTENLNRKKVTATFGVTSIKRSTNRITRGQIKLLLNNTVYGKQKGALVNTKNLPCFQA